MPKQDMYRYAASAASYEIMYTGDIIAYLIEGMNMPLF